VRLLDDDAPGRDDRLRGHARGDRDPGPARAAAEVDRVVVRAARRGVVLEFEDGTSREYVLVRGRGRKWFARWRRVEGLADGEGEPLLR